MSTVSSALNSRRVLRYFPWVAGLVLIAGVVAFSIAYFGNTAKSDLKNPPAVSNKPPQVLKQQQSVRLDPQVKQVANTFIQSAVARKNLAASYNIVAPELKQGMSLREWKTGNIPVVPYPVDKVYASPFKVDESYKNSAMLEVALLAKKTKSQIFYIGLKKYGKRWLVYYWAPRNQIYKASPQF